jgi:molybdopterin-containing oxidoreductase family membrane subunit
LLLAALATPLVLSVHSVVSFDFAVAQLPGWHTTIFPPYFVAGAIFSGFAMVITLAVPARAYFGLKNLITLRHLENICKIILVTSLMVGYAYSVELFTAWYSQNPYESFVFLGNRPFGPYGLFYWIMVSCNVIIPQLFWFKKCRTTPWIMVIIAVLVNVGMWMERFVIMMSLTRDFLPSSWGLFIPSPIDFVMLIGSFGLFFTLFLLFCRYLPVVAMAEVKTVLPHGHQP